MSTSTTFTCGNEEEAATLKAALHAVMDERIKRVAIVGSRATRAVVSSEFETNMPHGLLLLIQDEHDCRRLQGLKHGSLLWCAMGLIEPRVAAMISIYEFPQVSIENAVKIFHHLRESKGNTH